MPFYYHASKQPDVLSPLPARYTGFKVSYSYAQAYNWCTEFARHAGRSTQIRIRIFHFICNCFDDQCLWFLHSHLSQTTQNLGFFMTEPAPGNFHSSSFKSHFLNHISLPIWMHLCLPTYGMGVTPGICSLHALLLALLLHIPLLWVLHAPLSYCRQPIPISSTTPFPILDDP